MLKKILQSVFVIFIFFFFSIVFYKNIWHQVTNKDALNELTIQGETPVYEFVAETVKNNFISLKYPFSTSAVLYPFGWHFALDDVAPVFGIYFLILRPFLSIHQSFMLIVLMGIIVSGLTMYYLLLLLRVNKLVALFVSMVFCFSPFISVRIGAHPTYTAFYLFTLPAIFFIKLIRAENKKRKIFFSTFLAMSLALAFWTNLYFAVMIAFLVGFLLFFFYLYDRKNTINIIKKDCFYFLLSISALLIIILPWLKEVVNYISFGKIDRPSDWKDITAFSADLTNIFIPTYLNPFYRPIVDYLSSRYLYISRIFENFIYPGLIVIGSMIGYIFISKKLPRFLKPLFYTALVFLTLAFGPFLQILGNNLKVPLPYIIIPYLPLLNMVRSPGRFIAPFIFLAVIIAAFVVQYFLKRIDKKWWKRMVIVLFFAVFVFDQMAKLPPAPKATIPNKIYGFLSEQKTGVVLEIPFSIRDSIKNLGYTNFIWSQYVSLLHKQKIFSIYAGRVPNVIFNYYFKSPLIGSLGTIINSNKVDHEKLIREVNREQFIDALNFYQVGFTINKDNETYSPFMTSLLTEVGFKKIMTDGDYSLWQRQPKTIIISEINFNSPFDQFSLADGWGNQEPQDRSRWAMTHVSQIFLSLEDTKKKRLIIEAEAIVKPQTAKIFINDRYTGKMTFLTGKYNTQSIMIDGDLLAPGLNKISLKFSNTHILAETVPGATDIRPLALHVKYIGLK